MEDERTFTTNLKNASPKDVVVFIILLKNKHQYMTNLELNTRIKLNITNFQNYSDIVKKESDLCTNTINFDLKKFTSF